MKKGLFEQLEITNKLPKNKQTHEGRLLGNLFLNSGYETRSGKHAAVDLRAMLRLVDLADYLHSINGYKWHALNLVIKEASDIALLDDGNQQFYGVKFDVSRYLRDLTKRMCKDKEGNERKGAMIFYRWHLERSALGGFHTHVAMFVNGNVFDDGGFAALMNAKNKLREDKELGYQLVSLKANQWSRIREQDRAAKDYFNQLNYSIPNLKSDKPTFGLELKTLNDYRYALYVFSYQTKHHTKEYEDLGDGTHHGFTDDDGVRVWCNGTPVPKGARNKRAANEVKSLKAA